MVPPKPVSKSEQIVSIATGVLVDDGLDQFVLRRIADLADMKLGNLQYYFPTRDDLLEAVVRSEFAGDLATLDGAGIDGVRNDDPLERLAGIVAALTNRWLARNGSVYLPIAVLALHNERFATALAEIYTRFYALMADAVAAIDPTATPDVARQRAVLMTSVLDGASLQPGRNDDDIGPSLVANLTRLVTAIAQGR